MSLDTYHVHELTKETYKVQNLVKIDNTDMLTRTNDWFTSPQKMYLCIYWITCEI